MNELDELRRQLYVMTGKYEVARGIADKAINIAKKFCAAFTGNCIDCPIENCNFYLEMKSELEELDKGYKKDVVLKWRSAEEKPENESYVIFRFANGDYSIRFFEAKERKNMNDVKRWIYLSELLEVIE